jgi:hypothetical protein
MHEGLRLQYLPHENEELKDLVDDLLIHIRNAPCLVAHPGELTYECRHDNPCRVCEWREGVLKDLQREWDIQLP